MAKPTMPEGLSAAAQAEWTRVTGLLEQRAALDALDEAALRDYITCWMRLGECEMDIATRGVLISGERGSVKNPAAQLSRQYRDHLIAWSKELGLTPSARQRLAMPAPRDPGDDPWDQL